jgi:hypothetical protein
MLIALILVCSLATAAPDLADCTRDNALDVVCPCHIRHPSQLPHARAGLLGRAVRWGAISPATKPSRWSACAVRPTGSTKRKAFADDALPRNDDESFPGRSDHMPSIMRPSSAPGPGADRHRKGWARVDRGLPAGKLGTGLNCMRNPRSCPTDASAQEWGSYEPGAGI